MAGILLTISIGSGCNFASDSSRLSPVPDIATMPATSGTVMPISPTSTVSSPPERTPTPRPGLSHTIGAILDAPRESDGREYEVVGYFRGWDLLGEANGGPPVTRSDWVIADTGGAVYVTGMLPPGLNPSSRADIWTVVRLRAVVVYAPSGSVHLKALRVDIVAPGVPPSASTLTAGSPSKVPVNWRIEFARSGGFAGLVRSAELSDSGLLTVIDHKSNRRVAVQVPAKELTDIASLLPAPSQSQLTDRLPYCRDCFEYALDIRCDGQDSSVQSNDLGLAGSSWEPLVKALVRLEESALSGQLDP